MKKMDWWPGFMAYRWYCMTWCFRSISVWHRYHDLSRSMTKPTNDLCAQRRLRSIRPVWSESLLSAWRKVGSLAPHKVQSEDWSDWADAQADLSLRWVHRSFVGFVMLWLIYQIGLEAHERSEKYWSCKNQLRTVRTLFSLVQVTKIQKCPMQNSKSVLLI